MTYAEQENYRLKVQRLLNLKQYEFQRITADEFHIRIDERLPWICAATWKELLRRIPASWMNAIVEEQRWFSDAFSDKILVIELESCEDLTPDNEIKEEIYRQALSEVQPEAIFTAIATHEDVNRELENRSWFTSIKKFFQQLLK